MLWFKRPIKKMIPRAIALTDRQLFAQKISDLREMSLVPGPNNFRQAILEFDKLLDLILRKMEIAGNTLGDRLKNAHGLIDDSSYQRLWSAHKVRNKLAHDSEIEIMSWEAKTAIEDYEVGLEKFLDR